MEHEHSLATVTLTALSLTTLAAKPTSLLRGVIILAKLSIMNQDGTGKGAKSLGTFSNSRGHRRSRSGRP